MYDALPESTKQQISREEYIYTKHHDGAGTKDVLGAPGKTIWNGTDFSPLGDVIGEDDPSTGGQQTAAASGPTGDDIASAAKSSLGSLGYKLYGYNGIPAGQPKDHQFVADAIDKAGLGFGDGQKMPSAADWADPSIAIPGWSVVDGPAQAGDVLAMPKGKPDHWYFQPGQQMGIATGDDSSIGIRNNNQIAESDWGFRDDDAPTIRRHDSLMDDGNDTAAAA